MRQTKQELLEENARLKRQVKHLSFDRAFGLLTRPALFLQYRKSASRNGYLVFLDLDHVKELNARIGKSAVNRLVARAVNVRDTDQAIVGRVFSGDELGYIIHSHPRGFAERLLQSLEKHSLHGTIAIVKIRRGNLKKAIELADSKVATGKLAGQRGTIVFSESEA